jgi:LCP family protein required for cell wall assembly
MSANGEQGPDEPPKRGPDEPPKREAGERPEYTVYRSRPGFLSRLKAPDFSRLRTPRLPRPGRREDKEPSEHPVWRRIGIFAALWLGFSVLLFAISAQIQKTKLSDGAKDAVGGGVNLVTSKQTILVLGTDERDERTNEPGTEGPPRADTIMLMRTGAGAFRKLSIPRDSLAEIPGQAPQRINAAFAFGGPGLQVQTVEQFLGIEIDHVVQVEFPGFRDFIDDLGGIKVDLPNAVCSLINGGKRNGGFTLILKPGSHTLSGEEALALARTRKNNCNPAEDDRNRAARQQLILSGIKDRLTSPLRLPYNFLKGPIIGWDAPKAFVSDMGAFTLPQLVFAGVIGSDSKPQVLKPSGLGPGGTLIISDAERQEKVDKLLNG